MFQRHLLIFSFNYSLVTSYIEFSAKSSLTLMTTYLILLTCLRCPLLCLSRASVGAWVRGGGTYTVLLNRVETKVVLMYCTLLR